MKLYCQISGIPFRTNDSLPIQLLSEHPIFACTFDQLQALIPHIQDQEQKILASLNKDSDPFEPQLNSHSIALLAIESMKGKEFRNPAFLLFQSKKLLFLAMMKQANLLINDPACFAKPKPHLIDAYFLKGIELFTWASTIRFEHLKNEIPLYKINKETQDMKNLPYYLDEIARVRDSIGTKLKLWSDGKRIAHYEKLINDLAIIRAANNKQVYEGDNSTLAKWVCLVTSIPEASHEMWLRVLCTPSATLMFNGIKVNSEKMDILIDDLYDMQGWLENKLYLTDNPEGDGSWYFTAALAVRAIITNHILYFQRDKNSWMNATVSSDTKEQKVAGDKELIEYATLHNLPPYPTRSEHAKNISYMLEVAKWRTLIKKDMFAETEASKLEAKIEGKKIGASYDIISL